MLATLSKKPLLATWYIILLTGLNAVFHFMDPARLILAFLIFALLDLLLPKYGFIASLLVSLVLIHRSYYVGSIFDWQWLVWFIEDIGNDISALYKSGFVVVSAVTAVAMTQTAIILMLTLLNRLFLRGRGLTLFLCVGVTLLAGAHIWQKTTSIWYVVFYVFIGLVAKATVPLAIDQSFPLGRWLRNVSICVLALASVAAVLPAPPLDLSEWMDRGAWGSGPYVKVGYGSYDGRLGEPLVEDKSPALRVYSSQPVYLKGETRSDYTGKGWLATPPLTRGPIPQRWEVVPRGREEKITIQALTSLSAVFIPRYTLAIDSFPANPAVDYSGFSAYTPGGVDTGKFPYEYYAYKTDLKTGGKYSLTVLLPEDDPNYLRQLTNSGVDPCYTSLLNVSERVQSLAKSIVQGIDNGYDQAVALARYLRYGKWEYSLDTRVPPEDEDFVEYFLFEQETGYCVHFSTAFVLMARSVGLPARWAKGFSYGDLKDDGSYLVLNKHAHAWPEIWFSDYGWVPFEPTPGGAQLRREVGVSEPSQQNPADPDPKDPTEPVDAPEPEPQPSRPQDIEPIAKINWRLYASIMTAVAAALGVLSLLLKGPGKGSIRKIYARLQSRLRLFGWQRQQWETPREHIERVDNLPDRPSLTGLIHQFEHSVYGGGEDTVQQSLGRGYSLLGLLANRLFRRKG